MNPRIFFGSMFVFFLLMTTGCGSSNTASQSSHTGENNLIANDEAGQALFQDTLSISKRYVALRIATDNALIYADEYPDYESWNEEMTDIVTRWQELESDAAQLEESSNTYIEENEKISFHLVDAAYAYDKKEISDIFDKAPAGKKIRTLAKHLGVDAKRAWKILQQSQNEIQADVWNEEGDEYKKLEVTATVVKDGCKIAGFVGGVVLSGGTSAIVAGGTLAQTAVVVTGADLVLEVTDDAAQISFGNKNKVSEIVGDVRKITEPTAAILSIATMPENIVKGIDKLNVFVFGADQFRSVVQDGKVIGISLPKYEKGEDDDEIGMTIIDRDDIDEWLDENGYERYDGDVDDILGAYEDDDEEENEDIPEEEMQETDTSEDVSDASADADVDTASAEIGAVRVNFVSPTEPEFQRGQARMWKVEVNNFVSGGGASYGCSWKFYLDGSLYKEMKDTCFFTTTFISDAGHLKAEAEVQFLQGRSVFDDDGNYVDYVKDVIDTVTVSREYSVVAPVDTYRHP